MKRLVLGFAAIIAAVMTAVVVDKFGGGGDARTIEVEARDTDGQWERFQAALTGILSAAEVSERISRAQAAARICRQRLAAQAALKPGPLSDWRDVIKVQMQYTELECSAIESLASESWAGGRDLEIHKARARALLFKLRDAYSHAKRQSSR